MTSDPTPPTARPATPAITGPLALWLSLQLLALVASAIGMRWSATDATPPGLDGLALLLITQVVAATLLFQIFCSTPTRCVATAITTWPFLIAAGYLSATPWRSAGLSGLYLTGWILTLGVVHLKLAPLPTTVPVLLAMLVVGGPAITYVRLEFSGRETPFFGPISDLLTLAAGGGSAMNTLLPLSISAMALLGPLLKR